MFNIDTSTIVLGVIWVVSVIVFGRRFISDRISKFKTKTFHGTRQRVDIPKLMRERICKHGETDVDFRLYYASDDITPIEFFNYAMTGLHWPEVKNINQRKTHLYMEMASIYQGENKIDVKIWFFGKDEQAGFVKELQRLFETYEKAGCPPLEVEESVESIVARARGETVDLLNKYGFVWAEGS